MVYVTKYFCFFYREGTLKTGGMSRWSWGQIQGLRILPLPPTYALLTHSHRHEWSPGVRNNDFRQNFSRSIHEYANFLVLYVQSRSKSVPLSGDVGWGSEAVGWGLFEEALLFSGKFPFISEYVRISQPATAQGSWIRFCAWWVLRHTQIANVLSHGLFTSSPNLHRSDVLS